MNTVALILADAALETVPRSLWNHPAVTKNARKKGRSPGETLLDRSYHHAAMRSLPDAERRGRPDIIHFTLLEATSTPLYMDGLLEVYVHTFSGYTIRIGSGVRLPKTYFRFEALIEKLFKDGRIMSADKVLIEAERQSFHDLIQAVNPSIAVGLTRRGVPKRLESLAQELSYEKHPAVVVGAFPRGGFTKPVTLETDRLHSISTLGLESHVVVARLLYELEKVAQP